MSWLRIISAMFLVGGTSIGAGMIALPLVTGFSGFIPSLLVMLACCVAMTLSALLLVEVNLWMEDGAHIITMTSRLLGRWGEVASWILYLFICYASIVAYTAGGGVQLAHAFPITREVGCWIFIFVLGSVIYVGRSFTARTNDLLFIAMIGAYLALIGIGLPEVKSKLFLQKQWSSVLMGMPLLLSSFSFQTMVPSLTPYLNRDRNALRIAVIGGTSIAFIIYTLWQLLILGIIPVDGAGGLKEALCNDVPVTQFLQQHTIGKWLPIIAEYFAFFAIATSFLGMTLGLFDFLSDGLKIEKKGFGKVWLALLIVVPTLLFAIYFDNIFLIALDVSGGLGDSILNGMFPVLMIWSGVYLYKYPGAKRFPGGKPLLILLFAFFVFTLLVELLIQSKCLHSYYDIIEIHNAAEVVS